MKLNLNIENVKMKIGIIGGSGLDDPGLLENYEEKEYHT